MPFRPGDKTETFEAKIEHATPKALLIEMTLGGKYWLPRSQIAEMSDKDEYGNRTFEVSEWWFGKKTEVVDDK